MSVAERREPEWGDGIKDPPPLTPPHHSQELAGGGKFQTDIATRRSTLRKSKPKTTTAAYAERFEAEIARQQRRYCDAFARWRDCDVKACRRERACRGEQPSRCLKRALDVVPREEQRRAHRDIVKATPANIGAPERIARQCLPIEFYDGGADRQAIGEIKRLRETGKLVQRGDNVASLRLRLVEAGR